MIRIDEPALYFSKNMALKDITSDNLCHKQVEQLVTMIRDDIWPDHLQLSKEVLKVKTMSKTSELRGTLDCKKYKLKPKKEHASLIVSIEVANKPRYREWDHREGTTALSKVR